jgi:hypothetical protein
MFVVGLLAAILRLNSSPPAQRVALPPNNYPQPVRQYSPAPRTGPTLNGVPYGSSPYVETIDLNRPASRPPIH